MPDPEAKFPLSEIPRESWMLACEAAERSGNVIQQVGQNIVAGVRLSVAIGPTLLSIGDLLLIWFERVVLALFISLPFALLLVGA